MAASNPVVEPASATTPPTTDRWGNWRKRKRLTPKAKTTGRIPFAFATIQQR